MKGFRYHDPCCDCNCDPPCDPCCQPKIPAIQVTNGPPVNPPPLDGYPLAFNAVNGRLYLYLDGTGWTPYPIAGSN